MQTYTNDDRVGYYTVLDKLINLFIRMEGTRCLQFRVNSCGWYSWLMQQITKASATLEGLHLVPIAIFPLLHHPVWWRHSAAPTDNFVKRDVIMWRFSTPCQGRATDLLTTTFNSINDDDDDDDDDDDTFVPVLRNTPWQQTEWRYSSAWR
jgi:hypothetical protein